MIRLTHVTLRRGLRLLLDGADLTVHSGQRVGVVGANGVGKTSLFGILLGDYQVDSGDVEMPVHAEIASVAQEVDAASISALDYVVAGDRALVQARAQLSKAESAGDGNKLALAHDAIERIDGYTADSRAAQLLAGLGFSEAEQAASFSDFSGGWRMRLNLARALMCRSDILLLDEPTNHLDLDAIIWLENWLKRYDGILLLISHDRDFLDAVCTHSVHIEHLKLNHYTGNYSAFEKMRAERLAGQQAAYVKQQRDIAHMQKFVERFRYKASKARQAQSRLKSLERLELIAPAHVDSPFKFSFKQPEKMPAQLISVQDADFGYTETSVLAGVNLNIMAGERIGLLGANGAGKSTLIKSLVGELTPMQGRVERARELRVAYFAQHQVEQLRADESPLSFLKRLHPDTTERELRSFLGGFDFAGDAALAPIGPLSGGEKARLVLAAIIREKPNLLLLDEPTNHLDLEMRHALGIALQGFEGALVVVSHDRHLLQSVSDELKLVHGGMVDEYKGDLNDYARWLLQSRAESVQQPVQESADNSAQSRRERKRREADARNRLSKVRAEVKKLEDELEVAEAELEETESRLGDQDLYTEERKTELLELLEQQASFKKRIDEKESRWIDASEQLERLQRQEAS
ncbi:MAG: ATP-binding cassette domain-containing protein [Pseudomonadota bacterium]